jgi:hypothetical protein
MAHDSIKIFRIKMQDGWNPGWKELGFRQRLIDATELADHSIDESNVKHWYGNFADVENAIEYDGGAVEYMSLYRGGCVVIEQIEVE